MAARVERRADGTEVIRGLAPVYYRADDPGTQFKLWTGAVERVRPGAVAETIKIDDIRGLFNHDPSAVLGRRIAGTMRLTDTPAGLEYEIEPDDTRLGGDVLKMIRRGDVSGSSFSFTTQRVTWEDDEASALEIRWLEQIKLWDVGPVTYPAYQSSTSEIGSRAAADLAEVRACYERWRSGRPAGRRRPNYRRRLEILDLGS